MKYVYAALLLHSTEKPITEASMTKVLKAAGIEADEAKVKSLVASLSEINIKEALKSASLAATAPPAAAPASQPEAKKEKAPKEKKEEKKEEEALAGLGALFG